MGLLDELLSGALGGTGAAQRPQAGGAAGGAGALMALLPVVLAMLNGRGGAGPGAAMAPGGGLGNLGGLLGQMMGGGGASAGGGLGGLGGLGDLLGRIQQAGYGEQARSWVGTGQNLPINADAIGRIFGSDGLTDIARRAGLSEQEASQGLSSLLPEMVDRLTPSGSLPEPGMFDASLADLQRRLGL